MYPAIPDYPPPQESKTTKLSPGPHQLMPTGLQRYAYIPCTIMQMPRRLTAPGTCRLPTASLLLQELRTATPSADSRLPPIAEPPKYTRIPHNITQKQRSHTGHHYGVTAIGTHLRVYRKNRGANDTAEPLREKARRGAINRLRMSPGVSVVPRRPSASHIA